MPQNCQNFTIIIICEDVFTQPLHLKQDVTQGQFFKQSLTGLNSVFLLLDGLPNLN